MPIKLTFKNSPYLWLVIAAAILFYSSGLLPGRVLLPADILCTVLPWQATEPCAGLVANNPVLSDQVFAFFPWHSLVKEHGRQAVFWNPYAFAGSPMAGNGQSALFYPPNWMHFLLPPSWSYVLLALFHTIVAATFTYLFGRRYLSSQAAALAAASYVFSFAFVFSVGYPLGNALTWVPVLFWAVETRRTIALALATAMALLSGQPQTTVAVFIFLGGYAVWRWPIWRELVPLGVAVLAGAIPAAPQLFLLFQYVGESAASSLRSEFIPLYYSPHTLLEFLTPAFFGSSSPQYRWASNDGGYFGMIAALLAFAWIASRPRQAVRSPFFWMFAISLAFIFSIPPFVWILKLPYLKSMFVTKFWGTVSFAGAMLAGAALDAYHKKEFGWRSIAATGAAFIGIMAAARWHFRDFVSALNLVAFENRVLFAFGVSLLLSVLLLRWRPKLAVVLLIVESYYYLGAYNTAAPVELLYAKTPVVEFLQRDSERFRISGTGVFPANSAGLYGLEDVRGYDALTPRRYFEYMTALGHTFPDLYSRLKLNPGSITRETLTSNRDAVERRTRYWGPDFTAYLKRVFYWNESIAQLDRPALLDLLNVKYYLTWHGGPLPVGARDYRLVYSGEVDAYENPGRLPRAFVVPQWKVLTDEQQSLKAIRAEDFDPRQMAILCCASGESEQTTGGTFREAEILRYEPDEVTIQAEGPGVLVLADSYYPGWRAEGYELYQADHLFRGVVLPEGTHTVTFSFRPFSW